MVPSTFHSVQQIFDSPIVVKHTWHRLIEYKELQALLLWEFAL